MVWGYIIFLILGSNNLYIALASNLVQNSTTYNLLTIMTKGYIITFIIYLKSHVQQLHDNI